MMGHLICDIFRVSLGAGIRFRNRESEKSGIQVVEENPGFRMSRGRHHLLSFGYSIIAFAFVFS
jgi:hypothetical protein